MDQLIFKSEKNGNLQKSNQPVFTEEKQNRY